MSRKIHYLIESILIVVVLVLGGTLLKIHKKENEVVASIGEKEITRNEVQDKLSGKAFNTAVDNLINSSLIDQQFQKEKGKVTEKERLEQFPYVKLADSTKKNLSDKETSSFVDEYIKVKFLSEKYELISEDDLKGFLEEERSSFGTKVSMIKVIEGSHDKLSKLETRLNKGTKISSALKTLGLESHDEEVFSSYNEYGVDFSSMKKGEYAHHMGGSDHDDHSSHSTQHHLLYLEDTQDVNAKLFNMQENKDMIFNVYFSKNYNNVRIKLLNKLSNAYEIKK